MLFRTELKRSATISRSQKRQRRNRHHTRTFMRENYQKKYEGKKIAEEKRTFIEEIKLGSKYNPNDLHGYTHYLDQHFEDSRPIGLQNLKLGTEDEVNENTVFYYSAALADVLKAGEQGYDWETIESVYFPLYHKGVILTKEEKSAVKHVTALGIAQYMGIDDEENCQGILKKVKNYLHSRKKGLGSKNFTFGDIVNFAQEMVDENRFKEFKLMTLEEYNAMIKLKINESAPMYARSAVTDFTAFSGLFLTSVTSPSFLAGFVAFHAATRLAPIIMKHCLGIGNFYREEKHRRNEHHFNQKFKGSHQFNYHLFYLICFSAFFIYAFNNNMDKEAKAEYDKLENIANWLDDLQEDLQNEMIGLEILFDEIIKHKTSEKEIRSGYFNWLWKEKESDEFTITSGNDQQLCDIINVVNVKPNNVYLTNDQCKKQKAHIDGLIKFVKQVDPNAVAEDGSISITTLQKHQNAYGKAVNDELISRIINVKGRKDENEYVREQCFFKPGKTVANLKFAFWRDNDILGDKSITKMPEIDTILSRSELK